MILYGEMMLMGFLNLLVRERNRCQPNSNNSVKGKKIYFIDQKRCHFCWYEIYYLCNEPPGAVVTMIVW
jgi:hypothetical protein